jgi:hypothetical protein
MASLAGSKVAEIKVKHHARQFGESKYGLSRIYKVLLDLLSIKTILTSFARPLRIFAMFAGVSALIGLAFLAAGVIEYFTSPGMIFLSVGFLYTTLALVLLLWGVLGELVYRTGNLKLEHFAHITSTLKNRPSGNSSGKHIN